MRRIAVAFTTPIIYFVLIPAVLLDLSVTLYQVLCFPIYGLPLVRRQTFLWIDRHELRYLRWWQKINCDYCGYFNGLIGYVSEVAAQTEKYWCPIKHKKRIPEIHHYYKGFAPFGDEAAFRRTQPCQSKI